ncbi:restriction endonuclease [Porticoccaceae bacterium]|jgi:hypothetical protein|nr:restriction endonuclease [Porticoccaceae bacterium]
MKIIEYANTIQVDDYVVYSDGSGADNDYLRLTNENIERYKESVAKRCPFCFSEIGVTHTHSSRSESYHNVWVCMCGWWQHERAYDTSCFTNFAPGQDRIERLAELKHATVSSYDVSSSEVPTETLREYLFKNPNILYNINPYKLERLVQSVFQDHFACEVIHCGKSHDGGVDLVIVNSGTPIMVQVKRRQNPNHAEAVGSIREFLGAIMLKNSKHGIYVTTAGHFSRMSRDAGKLALENNLVKRFELIDFNSFTDILSLNHTASVHPWEYLFESS